jgi:Lrp/AsnC family transcriptional regulator, regulator for asnA, asnC and gidA
VAVTEIAEALAAVGSVTYIVVTAGRFDIWAELVCQDMPTLLALLDSKVRSLPGITSTEFLFGGSMYYRSISPAELG